MAVRRIVWGILATGHITAVVCGACHAVPDSVVGIGPETIRCYLALSGAESSYGFFAPNVGSLHRARFQLQDDAGATWWDVFDKADSSEARLRLTGIVDAAFMDGEAYESAEFRQRLIRSWAADMFRRHPQATSLTIVVEFYGVPSMDDYRSGSRPAWEETYRARVQRNDRKAADGRGA